MLITYVVLTAFAAATATIIFAFVATPQLVDNDDEEAGEEEDHDDEAIFLSALFIFLTQGIWALWAC